MHLAHVDGEAGSVAGTDTDPGRDTRDALSSGDELLLVGLATTTWRPA
ncbi:MAG: hypothetical protein WAU75_21820 [Solirubrobacteraceae bacterium]